MNIIKEITKKYLKLNKKQTAISIIGIVLTTVMITAVVTLAASFQDFMVRLQRVDTGDWEVSYSDVKYEDAKKVQDNSNLKDITYTENLDYAIIPNDTNEYKKNIVNVRAYNGDALQKFNIKTIEGKLPENKNEIVVSENLANNNQNVKIGNNITLNLGKTNINPRETDDVDDIIIDTNTINTKTYKVVGIIETPRFDSEIVNGMITYLDLNNIQNNTIVSMNFNLKNTSDFYNKVESLAKENNLYSSDEAQDNGIAYNKYVLMYMGLTREDGFQKTMAISCGILIGVIGICSAIVIYNGFNISISERKKQFGILSSIGATKRQIMKLVTYQGLYSSIIAIPLGLIIGIIGIAITLKVTDNIFASMLTDIPDYGNIHLSLVVSLPVIITAIICTIIVIFISVLIPAFKACKVSPIDAIRESDDIKVKSKKLKTSKLTRKLFGIEGEIAAKNLKRSKKKYRTTIISLVVSIVLFITFNGFISQVFNIARSEYQARDYDYEAIFYTASKSQAEQINNSFKDELKNVNGIDSMISLRSKETTTKVKENKFDSSFSDALKKNKGVATYCNYNEGDTDATLDTIFINYDDEYMKDYLNSVGINNLQDNEIVLVNYANCIRDARFECNITTYKQGDIIKLDAPYTRYVTNKDTKKKEAINETESRDFKIAKITDKIPYALVDYGVSLVAVVNQNTFDSFANSVETRSGYFMKSSNTNEIDEKMEPIMKKLNAKVGDFQYITSNITDQQAKINSLESIIQIFLYGFIVLISLIGVSNIFNTITTNINLRRREFANLKSIGMSDRAFNKMLNLESILYGTKALVIGIPIGVILCFLLSKAMMQSMGVLFKVPVASIIISIIFVYLIVFSTMLYSRNKVNKDNIVDVLKDENL